MKKPNIILLILCFSLKTFSGICQSKNELFADSLVKCGQQDFALKEYLRCIFYNKNDAGNDLYLKISSIFRAKDDYAKSIEYADYHYFRFSGNIPEQNKAIIEKIKVYLKKNEPNEALISASQLKAVTHEEKNTKRFYIGLSHLMRRDINLAKEHFSALTYLDSVNKSRMINLLDMIKNKDIKNPNNSMIYSAIIPGLGQAINGNYSDGFKSLMLITGLGVIFIEISKSLSFGNAVISVTPWLIRYFVGGMINASNQAKIKKEIDIRKLIFEVVAIIQIASKS